MAAPHPAGWLEPEVSIDGGGTLIVICKDQVAPGMAVIDEYGEHVGDVHEVYCSSHGRPSWIAVHTGRYGLPVSVVPLVDAEARDGLVWVPYARSTIEGAPRPDVSSFVGSAEESHLRQYYGVDYLEGAAETTGAEEGRP